jgi:hypothetical protein
MPSKTLVEWPTVELLADVTKSLDAAAEALERLGLDFNVLSGEYDPSDVAKETPTVTAETIAALVWFVELADLSLSEMNGSFAKMKKWPAQLAWVRIEQEEAASDA